MCTGNRALRFVATHIRAAGRSRKWTCEMSYWSASKTRYPENMISCHLYLLIISVATFRSLFQMLLKILPMWVKFHLVIRILELKRIHLFLNSALSKTTFLRRSRCNTFHGLQVLSSNPPTEKQFGILTELCHRDRYLKRRRIKCSARKVSFPERVC